jgi:hypothetical protein
MRPPFFFFHFEMEFKKVHGGGHPGFIFTTLRYHRLDTAPILPGSINMANPQDERQLAGSSGTSITFFLFVSIQS